MNEIRARAAQLAIDFCDTTSEDAEAKSFLDRFFHCFGIERRKVATFEHKVRIPGADSSSADGYIDLFWKRNLLVEMKSRGKDLDAAYEQARRYAGSLPRHELPRLIVVCDFHRFVCYDLERDNARTEFTLDQLVDHVEIFGFLAGYETRVFQGMDPVNVEAAERMGKVHDQLRDVGYSGHELEVYLVRLLFCMFADDTGIFNRDDLLYWIRERTSEDGADLGSKLNHLFQILDTPPERRNRNLDEQLAAFPYINGELFAERLLVPDFDSRMRELMLKCSELDWGKISPAIFGAMFQSVMDPKQRRDLGAHYTSEENILKVIGPLFLDALRAEFRAICGLKIGKKQRLEKFHARLGELHFLDPACGCGNFLVITYRELRLLELDVLRELHDGQRVLDIESLCHVNVDQFYGIEIEEFPSQIARVALWLTDHQMNLKARDMFGQYFARIPLRRTPHIMNGNALRTDWETFVPPDQIHYILGNPPFVGFTYMNAGQKEEMAAIFPNTKILDYVTAWYKKAARYIQGTDIEVGFVSTNSICQGEPVAPLWKELLYQYHVHIKFAHQTFKWSNEASGKAAVYCVIVGFSLHDRDAKKLYTYETVQSLPQEHIVGRINPYLVDGPDIIVESRNRALQPDVPPMVYGNKPVDGGHLIIEADEYDDFIAREPEARKYIRKLTGGLEFINGKSRWCLWLVDCPPHELRQMPLVLQRIAKVRAFRESSKKEATRKKAEQPALFDENRHPDSDYIAIPETSSERRKYIPIGFLDKDTICSNAMQIIPNATIYHFGILTSTMHMAWMRYVCGRLKSDYRYSKDIVYNNFPWPTVTDSQRVAISVAAQGVLDARSRYPTSSLADLYDPNTTPPDLLAAHDRLDRLVDRAYTPNRLTTDSARVTLLFERYQSLSAALLPADPPARRKKK